MLTNHDALHEILNDQSNEDDYMGGRHNPYSTSSFVPGSPMPSTVEDQLYCIVRLHKHCGDLPENPPLFVSMNPVPKQKKSSHD